MKQISLLCKQLRDSRESHGLTQEQAARILDMTFRTYWGYENGEKKLKRWHVNGIIKEFEITKGEQ